MIQFAARRPFSLRLMDGSLIPLPQPEFTWITQDGQTAIVNTQGSEFRILDAELFTALETGEPFQSPRRIPLCALRLHLEQRCAGTCNSAFNSQPTTKAQSSDITLAFSAVWRNGEMWTATSKLALRSWPWAETMIPSK